MNRRRPWIRHALTTTICVLLGVVLTVGVAWAATVWLQPPTQRQAIAPPEHWPIAVPADWPAPTTAVVFDPGFASRWLSVRFTRGQTPGSGGWKLAHCYDAGWPMLALRHYILVDYPARQSTVFESSHYALQIPARISVAPSFWGLPRRLPTKPLWIGFVVDTAFFAGFTWLLLFAPSTLRRTIRTRRNRCPSCGYDTRRLDTCPECGADT